MRTGSDIDSIPNSLPSNDWSECNSHHNVMLLVSIGNGQVTRVLMSNFKRIKQLRLFVSCESNPIFTVNGRILNPNKLVHEEKLKDKDIINILSEDPTDKVEPKYPSNWISLSSLQEEYQKELLFNQRDLNCFKRLEDIQLNKNFKRNSIERKIIKDYSRFLKLQESSPQVHKICYRGTTNLNYEREMYPNEASLPICWDINDKDDPLEI